MEQKEREVSCTTRDISDFIFGFTTTMISNFGLPSSLVRISPSDLIFEAPLICELARSALMAIQLMHCAILVIVEGICQSLCRADSFVVRYIGLHCDLIQNNTRTYLTKMHMQKKKTKMGFPLKKT